MAIVNFLLPIIAFFLADWFFEPLHAMFIALGLSVVLMIIESIKTKKIATSHIFDFILIVVFGLVEHFCSDDKSGLTMGLVTSLFIAVMMFPGLSMTEKMLQRFPLLGLDNPYKKYLVKKCQQRMIVWALFATLMYASAILADDAKISEWISTYAIWTVLSGYIATELIVNRLTHRKYRKVEWVPLMNEDGKMIGWAIVSPTL